MRWNDAGTYNCTAANERESDWAADFLNVTGKRKYYIDTFSFPKLLPSECKRGQNTAREINWNRNVHVHIIAIHDYLKKLKYFKSIFDSSSAVHYKTSTLF